jgi:hypothetical protein
MIALLALIGIVAQGSARTDDAPFTVVSARAAGGGGEVIVSIGTDSSRGRLLQKAVVLTGSAAVPATLTRTKRLCEDVCPGTKDGRVCHFEAVLHTAQAVAGAIAVLPGTRDVRNVTPLKPGPVREISQAEEWIAASSIPVGETGYRWARFPDGVYLTSPPIGRDFYAPPIALSSCATRAVLPFTVLVCGSTELLYEGRQGITASFADYGKASAMPIAHIQLDGRDAFLVRVGLKAEMVIALLLKESGKWRLTYREADYPLMC